MNPIKVETVRSDEIYKKMLRAAPGKKSDLYRYELMGPFEEKWACYHIPLKAARPGGYDVVMAGEMLGFLSPEKIDETQAAAVAMLADDCFWARCEQSVRRSLACFTGAGIELPVKNYRFTVLLANPDSPYSILNDDYCGDGGIPGYLLAWLVPSRHTLQRLPVALAHEANHNVRFQFEVWRNDITLGAMMVSEGLAENFAAYLYGEDQVGPWVSKTDLNTLNEYVKPIVRQGLEVQGLENLTAYLYGDEMAKMQHYFPVGLPYCAGYACGYHLVKHYLNKTGKSIVEATLTPAEEILRQTEDFWREA